MTTKEAIEQTLKGKRRGMRVPAIIESAVPLATGLNGNTPGQTIYSVLYAESKKFERTDDPDLAADRDPLPDRQRFLPAEMPGRDSLVAARSS